MASGIVPTGSSAQGRGKQEGWPSRQTCSPSSKPHRSSVFSRGAWNGCPMRCWRRGLPAGSAPRWPDAWCRRPMMRCATPKPCCSTRAASPTTPRSLALAVGGMIDKATIPGGARRRLLDPARLPAGAQAPWPLRAAVPRRSRRLLSARSRAQRRGGVDGPGAGDRARPRGGDGPRRPAAAGAR